MKALARRGFLRALGIAPAAAAAAGQAINQALGQTIATLPSGGPMMPSATATPAHQFASVASWWDKFGAKTVEREAKHVYGFDADILLMQCPMPTKVRMQRARNYERTKAERLSWMADQLSLKGVIEWWS